MLADALASRLQLLSVEERLDQYRFSAEDRCAKALAKEIVCDAVDCWERTISARDQFSLTVTCDGESKGVADFSEASRNLVNEVFEWADDECQLSLELIVKKRVQNHRLSVYSPDLLSEYFTDTPMVRVLEDLSGRLSGELIFECMVQISAASSSGISFECVSDNPKAVRVRNGFNRNSILEAFRENSFSRSLPHVLVPHDFNLNSETGVPGIDQFFKRACVLVSAIYLSNSSELGGDGKLDYRISGYKNLAGVVSIDELERSLEILFKIVDWAYGDGGTSDKVGLARNVMSLHVEHLQDVFGHPEIISAINSNYQIYLKENVESYLEVKGKITDVLVDAVKKTHEIVDSFLDSFRNGIFVLLTFVLTVVVVNGLKDTSAASIFSGAYIWVVSVLSVLMSVWVISARFGALTQFDKAFESIEQVLKVNYCGVLEAAEIEGALNPVRSSNRKYLRERSSYYLRLWLCIVILLVIGFVVGNRYFPSVPQSDSSGSSLNKSSEGKSGGERAGLPESTRLTSKPSTSHGKLPDRSVDSHQDKAAEFCCR